MMVLSRSNDSRLVPKGCRDVLMGSESAASLLQPSLCSPMIGWAASCAGHPVSKDGPGLPDADPCRRSASPCCVHHLGSIAATRSLCTLGVAGLPNADKKCTELYYNYTAVGYGVGTTLRVSSLHRMCLSHVTSKFQHGHPESQTVTDTDTHRTHRDQRTHTHTRALKPVLPASLRDASRRLVRR
jgi:hypothetical protein